MSITHWFVNKYIRVGKKVSDIVNINSIVIKYITNSSYQTESKLYINDKFILCHGPFTCSNSVKDYIRLVYSIDLKSSERSRLSEMFKYKVSGHIKLSNNFLMEIQVV